MDILKHIIPLICLLTIHDKETSFVEMFELIEKNEYVYNILIDQTKSWWGKSIDSKIIKKFINVYMKYMKDDKETNQIIRTVKELFMKNIKNNRELSNLIDKYLIPQELEKKSNAEVSTPFKLRQEMLGKIPVEFWTSIKKVFEPCAGKGGFIVDIIDRFMNGLNKTIPDEKERYRTIVEECLYFSDINPTNIFICKLLIDPYNEYKLNYNEGNTLELDIKEKWGIDGFDAIIGNPPYQPPSNNKKGGKSIWDEFVKYSLKNLKVKGLLLYVHPALWRKPKNKMRNIMFNKQIHYLSIHNKVEGKKIFGATTRYDYYLMEKIAPYKKSIVYFEDKKTYEIYISNDLPFIPNFSWAIFSKIIAKLNDNGICVIGDS
ncbi:MAG: Eco57I restriction-modification methylase domain-containing protein, partial [Pelagibacterales bacterium]|nr:Eco57I restriction-modification methylase domain-containing protein [Pelagibacterales bacterium]